MIQPLSEGTYTVDITKNFIPFNRQSDRMNERPASLLVDIVPFLIQTKNDLVIIDPGLGLTSPAGEFMIIENLMRFGFNANDVTMVLLSHLHKDHAGGICYGKNQSFNLMFPKADYYCQEKEMEYAFSKQGSSSFDLDKLDYLRHTSNLKWLNGNGRLNNEIQYEVSGGHTPYHQVFYWKENDHPCFYGGDVLPQPSQIIRRFMAKYDFEGKKSAALRQEWAHAAAANRWILLFFHDAQTPMARVTEHGNRFHIGSVT